MNNTNEQNTKTQNVNASTIATQALEDFSIVRTGSEHTAAPGTVVNQTLTLYNKSQYEIDGVHIQDTISQGATFQAKSVYIGGRSFPDINPLNGFDLNEIIASGNSETITYKIVMDDPMPDTARKVNLQSNVQFNVGKQSHTQQSNVYVVDFTHGEIEIEKTSDKSAVIKGQTLLFQNVVKNIGTLEDTNVFFIDTIPQGMTFVEKSVKIDDVLYEDYNPSNGFSLGNISGKSQKTVTFEVTID